MDATITTDHHDGNNATNAHVEEEKQEAATTAKSDEGIEEKICRIAVGMRSRDFINKNVIEVMQGVSPVGDVVRTNVPQLDDALGGGFAPGLHCVTGGPSSYKSAFLLQVAYMAALDGYRVLYITDEISKTECVQRLTCRKLMVDAMRGGAAKDIPAWSQIGERALDALVRRDLEEANMYNEASMAVSAACLDDESLEDDECGFLHIEDMGKVYTDSSNAGFTDYAYNTRYLTSAMLEYEDVHTEVLDYCDLLIIDAVNALRLFKYSWNDKYETWETCDHMPEPRTRMEEIVTTLDNFSREHGIATVGVFHGNRTRGQSAQHPSMGDFKETSAIEYRAVSAIELARANDMHWTGHPKAPFKRGEYDGEAVGVFVLKSRKGRRTEENKPIWLVADGAHNLLMPLDMLRR